MELSIRSGIVSQRDGLDDEVGVAADDRRLLRPAGAPPRRHPQRLGPGRVGGVGDPVEEALGPVRRRSQRHARVDGQARPRRAKGAGRGGHRASAGRGTFGAGRDGDRERVVVAVDELHEGGVRAGPTGEHRPPVAEGLIGPFDGVEAHLASSRKQVDDENVEAVVDE